MTEITAVLTTVEREDGRTLHIVDRSTFNTHTPYTVCWNLKVYELNHAEWDWGTYCTSLKKAVEVLRAKCKEHDFPLDDDCQEYYCKHNESGICTQHCEDVCPNSSEAETLIASFNKTMWEGGDE